MVLLVALVISLLLLRVLDPTGLAWTAFNRTELLRLAGWLGLLALAQQVVRAGGELDLSLGATAGLTAVLVTGLAPSLGLPLALAGSLLTAQTVALSVGGVSRLTGWPAAAVSVVPLLLLTAATPPNAAALAPEPLRRIAFEPLGGVLPLVTLAWLALLPVAAWLLRRPAALGAWAFSGLCGWLVGLWAAGGAAVDNGVMLAAGGLAAALLAAEGDLLSGALAVLTLAALRNAGDLHSALGAGSPGRGGALVTGVALLAGLLLSRRSPHAE